MNREVCAATGMQYPPVALLWSDDKPAGAVDVMTVSVPWKMFLELERNVPGSFLEQSPWRDLMPGA